MDSFYQRYIADICEALKVLQVSVTVEILEACLFEDTATKDGNKSRCLMKAIEMGMKSGILKAELQPDGSLKYALPQEDVLSGGVLKAENKAIDSEIAAVSEGFSGLSICKATDQTVEQMAWDDVETSEVGMQEMQSFF